MVVPLVHAQEETDKTLKEVVISASRAEQRRFDAPGAIDAVQVDPFRTASPLVNLSELMDAVPGLQIRDRQNFAQDLQLSVRDVCILIDRIPATMPDGQGQAVTASLISAKRIELLRDPLAQLYGNAARREQLNARLYGATRKVDQKLAFLTNGVVNLDRSYGGVGASWTHAMQVNQLPVRWTVGVEAGQLRETRKGFDNLGGNNGPLRRNEDDTARNTDVFGQLDWTLTPAWQAIAGVRASRVRFNVDDRFKPAASSTSGSVEYRNTSPVVGLVWHAAETLNVYANLGTGFETPTLAESAYRPGGAPGPNFSLKPSKSTQGEIGVKLRSGRHSVDAALLEAWSKDEIVSSQSSGGRAIFQNADRTRRRGLEAPWSANWTGFDTRIAYTLLDARFKSPYAGAQGPVSVGNRLPGPPRHSLFADAQGNVTEAVNAGLEMRMESKTYVNDLNSDAAPGYAVFKARLSREFQFNGAKMVLYGRIDNLLDRTYAGSLIINNNNGRYFEAAPGRRLFVGARTLL